MREFKEEEDPQKPSFQKVGILMLLLLVLMMVWFLDGYFSDNEQEIDCDPEHEDCDKLKIIVRFIGNYEQLLSYT